MAEPKAFGMVLAAIVDPKGKTAKGSSAKGQLYVSTDEIVVLRPTPRQDLLNRIMTALLVGSVVLVVTNLFAWKSMQVIYVALAAQGIYWATLPRRRRAVEPEPLSGDALGAARKEGRAAIYVPAKAVVRTVPPDSSRPGFRTPARFELPDGALEIYLSQTMFEEIRATLAGR